MYRDPYHGFWNKRSPQILPHLVQCLDLHSDDRIQPLQSSHVVRSQITGSDKLCLSSVALNLSEATGVKIVSTLGNCFSLPSHSSLCFLFAEPLSCDLFDILVNGKIISFLILS